MSILWALEKGGWSNKKLIQEYWLFLKIGVTDLSATFGSLIRIHILQVGWIRKEMQTGPETDTTKKRQNHYENHSSINLQLSIYMHKKSWLWKIAASVFFFLKDFFSHMAMAPPVHHNYYSHPLRNCYWDNKKSVPFLCMISYTIATHLRAVALS